MPMCLCKWWHGLKTSHWVRLQIKRKYRIDLAYVKENPVPSPEAFKSLTTGQSDQSARKMSIAKVSVYNSSKRRKFVRIGHTSHIPSLRRCISCVENDFICSRVIVLVLTIVTVSKATLHLLTSHCPCFNNSDCEQGNKTSFAHESLSLF